MKEQFDAVKMEVPFADFPEILSARGLKADPEFGGNCVHQSRVLAEKLRADGYSVSFIKDLESSHWAILANDGVSDFYMDPYLLHKNPINISDLKESGGKTVEALPIVEGKPSKVIITPTVAGFDINIYGYKSRFRGYQHVWSSKYNLSIRKESITPSGDGYPSFFPRAFFNLKVPLEDGSVIKLLWEINTVSNELKVENIGEHPQGANIALPRLSSRLRTSETRLISTLQAANDLYYGANPESVAKVMKEGTLRVLDLIRQI